MSAHTPGRWDKSFKQSVKVGFFISLRIPISWVRFLKCQALHFAISQLMPVRHSRQSLHPHFSSILYVGYYGWSVDCRRPRDCQPYEKAKWLIAHFDFHHYGQWTTLGLEHFARLALSTKTVEDYWETFRIFSIVPRGQEMHTPNKPEVRLVNSRTYRVFSHGVPAERYGKRSNNIPWQWNDGWSA